MSLIVVDNQVALEGGAKVVEGTFAANTPEVINLDSPAKNIIWSNGSAIGMWDERVPTYWCWMNMSSYNTASGSIGSSANINVTNGGKTITVQDTNGNSGTYKVYY